MNILQMALELKLSYVKDNFEDYIEEAKHTKMDYEIFLETLLKNELLRRAENGVARRLRYAKFPIKKYLEDFDRTK
jgi:DNA replication protein DnaC